MLISLALKSVQLAKQRKSDIFLFIWVQIPTIVHLCYGYPGGGGQHEYEYPSSWRS
jgi:hypothetical protein